ncbi:SPASM domain-containing protein [bacterium]|nr:SPASM domain-containing protein [bacterium]
MIHAYRAEISKSLGKAFNAGLFRSCFVSYSGKTIDHYRKITERLGCPLSELRMDRIHGLLETGDFLNVGRPNSLWVEISAVNDVPPIYSPLNHWKIPKEYPPYMPFPVFSRLWSLVTWDIASCPAIHLGGLGEPLQHPDFMEFLELIHHTQEGGALIPNVHCYTDGRCLTEDIARKLVLGVIQSVMISLDAVEESYYRKVRPNGDFQAVKRNLDQLLELKRQKQAQGKGSGVLPGVALATTMISELVDHLDAFMTSHMTLHRFGLKLGKNPLLEAKRASAAQYFKEGHVVEHLVIQGASTFAGQNPDRRLAIYTPLKRFACRRLSQTLFVKTDGSIVLCDRVFSPDASTRIGNVMEVDTLQELWDRLDSKRRMHSDGKYTEAYERCGSCEDWFIPVD